MKLWVWEGVLTDYTSGLVCVHAETEERAWELLKAQDKLAWRLLTNGDSGYCDCAECLTEGEAIRPRCVDSEEVLVVYGGG